MVNSTAAPNRMNSSHAAPALPIAPRNRVSAAPQVAAPASAPQDDRGVERPRPAAQVGELAAVQRHLRLALGLDPGADRVHLVGDAPEAGGEHAEQRGHARQQEHRRQGELDDVGDGVQ